MPTDPEFSGIFLIIVGRAPGNVWHVQPTADGRIREIVPKDPRPWVNHYAFHIQDPEWGHLIIRFCPHPPFNALVILNGHEYVAGRAARAGLRFRKEGNCFTEVSDAADLGRIAETLSSSSSIGRLVQVCDRWLYSAVLCFAVHTAEQERTGFRYSYSAFQAEYSRNLVFRRGGDMDRVFDGLIERTRGRLDIRAVRTVFGRKHRPHRRKGKRWASAVGVAVERPAYDLTIFKLHFGLYTLKAYTKGERVLRLEAIVHNARALHCGTGLDKFPRIIAELREWAERFLEVLDCLDASFVEAGLLDELCVPGQVGRVRVGGVDIDKPRMRAVMEGVIALSPLADGFTASALAERGQAVLGDPHYTTSRAAYDLRKLRAKRFVTKIPRSRRYRADPEGLRAMAALLVLREKVIRPVLAGAGNPRPGRPPKHTCPIDQQYRVLQKEMHTLFGIVGIAA